MAYWLFKEEPTHYSFDNLMRDKRAIWDGVQNNLALQHLRNVQKDDRVLYYHTGDEKAIVGIMKVARGPYRDPAESDERLVVVDVQPVRRLDHCVTLKSIKGNKFFSNFALVKNSRLSVMPVTDEQWAEIERMSRGPQSLDITSRSK